MADEVDAAVQALKTGISTFMEDMHWFMKTLDEVAKIHPFVAGLSTILRTRCMR